MQPPLFRAPIRTARRVSRPQAGAGPPPAASELSTLLLLVGALVEVERVAPGVVAEGPQLLLLLLPPPRAAAGMDAWCTRLAMRAAEAEMDAGGRTGEEMDTTS